MHTLRRLPEAVWHLLIVSLWGLPLVTPLLRWTAVPCTHDGHLHYHRIAAMRHAWENGLYFSRWLPDLAFGYGYPFFVYREPTPLYASLIPHLLGIPLPAAENLFYIGCILGAGWFMYLWVHDILGARAALVSALAYMAAPYVLVDALVRGNSPESLALTLMPFLLWIGRRWLLRGTWQTFAIGTFGLAFFALSHNISLLIFTPFLLIYLLLVSWSHRLHWRTVGLRLILLFGLGLGMTSFYTGGALLEIDAVTLSQSTTTRNNDFRYNFASLGEIFAPVTPEDPTLLNPPLPFRLGWVPVGLALLGLVGFWFQRRGGETQRGQERNRVLEQRWHVWLMVGVTAVYLLLALPITLLLWENIPLIDFVQFPWRFVGRAALPLAFLAGLLWGDWRLESRDGGLIRFVSTNDALRMTYYLALLLLTIETIPNLYPAFCEEELFPTINTVHRYEHETGLVGVDPEGSYFPKTVGQRPSSSPLEPYYQNGTEVQRWDIPATVTIHNTTYDNLRAEVHLTAPEPFVARYYSFAFPGWTAVVDDTPIPIQPSDPEGLITFPVPAGEHTLTVRWQSTPLRSALVALSVMALAGAVVTAVLLRSNQLSVVSNQLSVIGYQPTHHKSNWLLNSDYWLLLFLPLAVLAFKWLLVDRTDIPLRQPGLPAVAQPVVLRGDGLQLMGYNLSHEQVESGGMFDIDMAWTAVAPPTANLQTNIWLVDETGLAWSDKETHRPRIYEDVPPTPFWQPGQWAWDSREVAVFSGTPPGEYDIVLTLFDLANLQAVTLLAEDGAVVGPTAVIGTITITEPQQPPRFTPQYSLQATLPGLQLLGYNQDRAAAAPGDQLLLTLFWQNQAAHDEIITLHLVEDGTSQHSWQLSLPTNWQAGDRLRSQHGLRLPATLNSGDYQFMLADTVALGRLTIHAPERIFEQPEVATAVNTPFTLNNTAQATLVGYTISNLQSPISNLPLTLLWQTNAEMPISYHVFIHLLDEEGNIIAQTDGEPANWTRPTTGWAAGEYIVDEHIIQLPTELAGETLRLRVGLYNAETGERLRTETADYIEITLVPIPDL